MKLVRSKRIEQSKDGSNELIGCWLRLSTSVDALVICCAGTVDDAVGSGCRGAVLRKGKPAIMKDVLLLIDVVTTTQQ